MIGPIRFYQTEKIQNFKDNADRLSNGSFIWCDETERFYIKMKDKVYGITPAHRDIKEIKCKNCGGPIHIDENSASIVSCEHCGSTYDIDNYNIDFE